MLVINSEGRLARLFFNARAWHDKFLVFNFFISFTFLLLIWGEVIWALFSIREAVFLSLHYSIYFGVDWLGGPVYFFVFTGLATAIFILNFLLSNMFYNKKRLLSYFLSITTSFLEILMLVVVSLIIYINWTSPTGI